MGDCFLKGLCIQIENALLLLSSSLRSMQTPKGLRTLLLHVRQKSS